MAKDIRQQAGMDAWRVRVNQASEDDIMKHEQIYALAMASGFKLKEHVLIPSISGKDFYRQLDHHQGDTPADR